MNNESGIIFLGAGGHAQVLLDCLTSTPIPIFGAVTADPSERGATFHGLKILGAEAALSNFPNAILVNAIGSTSIPLRRDTIFQHLRKRFTFLTITHPSAIIANGVILEAGAQIMAGVIIQPATIIGANALINTRVSIDHDCDIGESVHIAPGAVLSGHVRVGARTHIGAGATIIQGITIGQGCLIAAGAVVTASVESGMRVAGVPARQMSITAGSQHEELAGHIN